MPATLKYTGYRVNEHADFFFSHTKCANYGVSADVRRKTLRRYYVFVRIYTYTNIEGFLDFLRICADTPAT